MAGQDTSNFSEMMKIRYAKALSETIQQRVVLYAILTKTSESWTGKHHQTPVYLRSANSVGARGELGSLPTAGNDTYQESHIGNKNNYVVIKATNVGEALTSQGGAWASVKTQAIKNAAKDLTDSLNRQLNGVGKGILAECASYADAGGSAGTVTLKTYGDGTVIDNGQGAAPDTTKHFKPGMKLAFGRASSSVAADFTHATPVAATGTVNQVLSNTTFSVSGVSANPATNDVFVIGEGTAAGSFSFDQEMAGLGELVSDGAGTFQNIDPSAFPEWKAQVLSNPAGAGTERQLTEGLMQEAVDRVYDLSTGDADFMICHTSTRRAYLNLLKSKGAERFAPTKMIGGHSSLTFNGGTGDTQIFADKDALHRTMFVLTRAHLKMFEVKPPSWDETGGAVWKWVSGEDAATAFMRVYTNLGTDNRKALCRINDIAVTGIAA